MRYYLIYKIINTTQFVEFLFRVFAQIGLLNYIVFNRGNIFISKY